MAQAYLQRGAKAYRERNWGQAADNFHRATELQPGNARAWYLLALACAENRRWQQQAVNAIERACELDPINVEYLKLGGKILTASGLSGAGREVLYCGFAMGRARSGDRGSPAEAQETSLVRGVLVAGHELDPRLRSN